MILQDMKETKRYGHTVGCSDGQRENSIPSHKHSLRGGIMIILNDEEKNEPLCVTNNNLGFVSSEDIRIKLPCNSHPFYISLVVRKPVFGVSDQVPHKPGSIRTRSHTNLAVQSQKMVRDLKFRI